MRLQWEFSKKNKEVEVAVKSKKVTPQASGKDVGEESMKKLQRESTDLKGKPGFYEKKKVMNIFVCFRYVNKY